MRLTTSLLAVFLAALAMAGCGGDTAASDDLTVVATTTILGDLAANVAGDDAEVVVLMPVGADPHDFQASAAQVAAINGADLVVANGLGLEEGLEDVLDAAASDGVRILEIGTLVDPLPFDADEHEDEGDHEHGSEDPHIWFDLTRMATASTLLADELTQIAPDLDWESRAEAYSGDLLVADEAIATLLSAVADTDRRLVTSHGSLGYFAARYDFEVIGTVFPAGSTLADPSSEQLANLVEVMRTENVTVIFGETTQPETLAAAVAGELGSDAQVVSLYTGSLGAPGSGADSLIGMAQLNAGLIADALSG
ncbi:MAG: metal ABC transporter substrate-binding protein [Acidimicrobiia bacterium]|nr:metal ABC transporter substrate-binding protein [Acidimicrobiia bacterium]